jgi:hypothetical protein
MHTTQPVKIDSHQEALQDPAESNFIVYGEIE